MSNLIKSLFIIISLFLFFAKCAGQAKLYKTDKYKKGLLSNTDYAALRAYLKEDTPDPLKDTIVIKYDFKGKDCWIIMDMEDDSIIENSIAWYEKNIAVMRAGRPGISIFEYRQQGDNIEKYKKWDSAVKIDKGFLRKLLFKKKAVCGTTAIILPDHQFLLIRSDSHFEGLHKIDDLINKYFSGKTL